MTGLHHKADPALLLDPQALAALMERRPEATLLDVRSPGEFAGSHIPGSVNVPLEVLKADPGEVVRRVGGEVAVLCQSGVRSQEAAELLKGAGVEDLRMLQGGINAWRGAGLQLKAGKGHWAMDRQIRLVAGGLVLASLSSSAVFPAAAWGAVAVGAGLFLSAVTNTCAMGHLLGRLPYNRRDSYSLDRALGGTQEMMAA